MFLFGLVVGMILGLLIVILLFAILVYNRRQIEAKISEVVREVEQKNPKARGFIVEPDSEADEARQEIIKRNAQVGRDTRIEELL